MNKLTTEQKAEIDYKLQQGAVNRASSLSLFYAVSFVIYGFTSIDLIRRFNPNLELWTNVWPRIVFNGIPFLFFYFYFRKYKQQTKLKLLLWTLGLPAIFVAACMIQIWPLIMAGHAEVYPYVHGTNAFILTLACILVAPPPKYLISLFVIFSLTVLAPLSAFFIQQNNYALLQFLLGDFAFVFLLAGMGANMSFKLRLALATEDVLKKNKIGKFVGQMVSESIFENNESLIQSRQSNAFLISLDVRGFTHLMKKYNSAEASLFKERYHHIVAKVVGDLGGFIHKTHGDGHLISLGLMSKEVDLADVPGIQNDMVRAEKRKREAQLGRVIVMFERIFGQFEQLRDDFNIDSNVCICGAIDFGEIGLKLQGDPNVRLEFDLEGMVVIRCSRLEAYTKTLRERFQSDNSFLILSAASAAFLEPNMTFQNYSTHHQIIRDFPDETHILFKEYRRRRMNRNNAA